MAHNRSTKSYSFLPLENALQAAALNDNLDQVKTLLQKAAEQKKPITYPIHEAIHVENSKMVSLFIQAGADLTLLNAAGQTPLEHALSEKYYPNVLELLTVNKNPINKIGRYILESITLNQLTFTEALLKCATEHHQEWNDWSYTMNKFTALHEAVYHRNIDMVKLLIQYGANLGAKNSDDQTPLELALSNQSTTIATELLAANKEPIQHIGKYIMKAADDNNITLARALLKKAAELKEESNLLLCDKATALHYAVRNQNIDMVKLFIEYKVDLTAKNSNNQTATELALDNGYSAIALELLKVNNQKINNIYGYLLHALRSKNLPLVELLLEHKKTNPPQILDKNLSLELFSAALDTKNPTIIFKIIEESSPEYLPFYILKSISSNNIDLTRSLIQRAETLKVEWRDAVEDHTLNSPMHCAIKTLNIAMVKLLLSYNAELSKKNKDGQDLFQYAIQIEKVDIYELHKSNIGPISKLMLAATQPNSEQEEKKSTPLDEKKYEAPIDQIILKTQLLKSIHDGNLNKMKSFLTDELLDDKDVQKDVAVNETVQKYLLLQGAKNQSFIDAKIEKTYHQADVNISRILSLNQAICKKQLLAEHERVDMKSSDEFAQNILTMIDASLDGLQKAVHVTLYEKMDMMMLTSELLQAMADVKDSQELTTHIKIILAKREDAILNSGLDYCYTPDSHANYLCHLIAQTITDELPSQLLLHQALTKDRQEPWCNYLDEKGGQLPEVQAFFRLPGNEIHLYKEVVDSAIARVKEGKKLLPHIWFGTDPKNIKPVPPLQSTALTILKQRSPTLRKFIDYTEALDAYYQIKRNVLQQFELLRDGLLAGNYKVTNNHFQAGQAAYAALAEFSEWWNTFDKHNPGLCNQIRAIGHDYSGRRETLGEVLDILFDQKNYDRRNDATYCVDIKAHMIDRIIKEPAIRLTLEDITIIPGKPADFDEVSTEKLDEWNRLIFQELIDYKPKRILIDGFGKFPDVFTHLHPINYLLWQHGFNIYTDSQLSGDKIQDSKMIIHWILTEKDNLRLGRLLNLLEKDEFNYLRSLHHEVPYTFFAYTQGKRVQTSECYATIQKAFAEQMVLNVTENQKTKEDANIAVKNVCAKYPFIKNKTTTIQFSSVSDISRLFNGRRSLEDSRKKLSEKMARLSERIKINLH